MYKQLLLSLVLFVCLTTLLAWVAPFPIFIFLVVCNGIIIYGVVGYYGAKIILFTVYLAHSVVCVLKVL